MSEDVEAGLLSQIPLAYGLGHFMGGLVATIGNWFRALAQWIFRCVQFT